MLRVTFLCILVCAGFSGASQKAPVKFGDASLDEVRMTIYPKDSSASAVVLMDFGESSVTYTQGLGFQVHFDRIRRIKILKKEGFEWADFQIMLYNRNGNEEKLSGLKGVTYNLENGKVVITKLKNDGIFKEKYDENHTITKFTMPNVSEGSVVEYTYSVISDFLFNFHDWDFQTTIPVVWSEYRADIPEFFNYSKYTQGYLSFAINDRKVEQSSITFTSFNRPTLYLSNQDNRAASDKLEFSLIKFRWAVQNAPAFKAEPHITTYRDYISGINFELASIKYPNEPIKNYTGSWEEINTLYAADEDFGLEVTGNGFLKRIVDDVVAKATTPEEKINAIVAYVKANTAWNGINRKYTTKKLRTVLDDKKGNSAEINLLLASMLDKGGLQVYPVLISTRDNGYLRDFIPNSSQFNSVVCLVKWDDKKILVDATEDLLPTGFLPEQCLNGKGLVVSKGGFEWVSLDAPVKSRYIVNADMKIDEEGKLNGNLKFEHHGYRGLSKRKAYQTNGEQDYVKALTSGRS